MIARPGKNSGRPGEEMTITKSSQLRRFFKGEIPLRTAFWLGFALPNATFATLAFFLTRTTAGLDDIARLSFTLARDGTGILVFGLTAFMLWRAATRAAAGGGRAAPACAKLMVLVVATGALHYLATTGPGRVNLLAARLDPALANYTLTRTAVDEITFHGALNDRAARELTTALAKPGIRVLRINSHGGLIIPAMALADRIAKGKIAVVAREKCLSTCTLLLAASPNAIVTPATRVVFHRPKSALPEHAADAAEVAIAIAAWHARYREYGVPARAVEIMSRRETWAPGLAVLAELGMIKFVLDGRPPRLVPARTWCRAHISACGPAGSREATQ